MSANETLVAVIAIIAIVFVLAIFLFLSRKKKLAVRARLPLGTEVNLEGDPQSPPKPGEVRGKGLEAGNNLTAQNRVGGDVEVEDSSAAGDIHLSTQADGGSPDPKY